MRPSPLKIFGAQATAIPFQPGMTAFLPRTMMGPQPGAGMAGMGEEKSLGGMVGLSGWIYGQRVFCGHMGMSENGVYPQL